MPNMPKAKQAKHAATRIAANLTANERDLVAFVAALIVENDRLRAVVARLSGRQTTPMTFLELVKGRR